MINNKKQKSKKKNHPFKHKLKVLLTLFLCLVVVLLTATYITYLVTHKDNNRNANTYSNNDNVSLIEKNIIDAFSNTKNIGKFSFSISDFDRKTNQSLTFDFTYIEDSIFSLIFCKYKIKISYLGSMFNIKIIDFFTNNL